uniref:Secreted protein n=1 Tax=Rhipicephalus microplus TaxID=6941 RepID=A0A6M2DB85_RHIMP
MCSTWFLLFFFFFSSSRVWEKHQCSIVVPAIVSVSLFCVSSLKILYFLNFVSTWLHVMMYARFLYGSEEGLQYC